MSKFSGSYLSIALLALLTRARKTKPTKRAIESQESVCSNAQPVQQDRNATIMYSSAIQTILDDLQQQSEAVSLAIESSSTDLLEQARLLDAALRDESANIISLKSIQDALSIRQTDGSTSSADIDSIVESIAATASVATSIEHVLKKNPGQGQIQQEWYDLDSLESIVNVYGPQVDSLYEQLRYESSPDVYEQFSGAKQYDRLLDLLSQMQ